MTTTEKFSTAAGPLWVNEDIYVGVALNLIFAEADKLESDLQACQVETTRVLATDLNKAEPFKTVYTFSESHIQRSLIPALENLKDIAADGAQISGDSDGDGQDETVTFQQAIDNWNKHLALNDSLKTEALKNTDENRSFSAGAAYEYSQAIDSTWTLKQQSTRIFVESDFKGGAVFNALGFGSHILTVFDIHSEWVTAESEDQTNSKTIGYVLADDDPGDFFSVDVAADPVYGTPVFGTKSGRSSAPYEENTQPRDLPEISISPPVQHNVPADESAVFTLSLTNAGDSKETREYVIHSISTSNPGGAAMSVNGPSIVGGRSFFIDPGQTQEVTLSVSRGPNRYAYEDLAIQMYPAGEYGIWEAGGRNGNGLILNSDTLSFSVFFQAPCSDISILRPKENWALNASNWGDSLEVLLSGFNLQVSEDERVETLGMEYRLTGTSDWLPAANVLASNLVEDATSWPAMWLPPQEGDYEVRAFTSCPIGGTVYSDVLPGFVDTKAPRVFGTPEPADEVLALGDDIRVTFDEEIDCGSIMTQGQFVNAELSFATGDVIEGSEAVCNGNSVVLSPPATFDWAAAENQRLEARLHTDVLDGDLNPVVITDVAGNPLAESATWSFVVQRSAFAWTPSNLRIGGSDVVSSTLVNGRPEETSFTLTGLPGWITPSATEGTLPPGGELAVDFALDLSAGLVADTIAASTSSGDALLYFTCGPDWRVDPAAFEYSMSLTAKLFIDGVPSTDSDDLVAAFVGSDLRGLASPGADGSVSMTAYSNRAQGDVVTFEIYDASDCRLYQGDQTTTFEADALVDLNNLDTGGLDAQSIAINAGWTWISVNRGAGVSLGEGMASTSAQANDLAKSQTAFSMYDGNGWVGSLDSLAIGKAYQVKLSQAGALTVLGAAVDPAATPIALASGWNWVGYLPQEALSVDDALASLSPTVGDLVKSQTRFAQYVDGAGWVGSLTEMAPGQGYQMKMANGGALTYPAAVGKIASAAPMQRDTPVQAGEKKAVQLTAARVKKETAELTSIAGRSAYSMTLTATLKLDGQALSDSSATLRAVVGDELRGEAHLQYVEALEGYQVFLMLFANAADGEEITIEIEANGQTHVLEGAMPFLSNGTFGTPDEPLELVVETEAYKAAMAAATLPKTFALDQNYPNPFNPTTTIRYALPETADVEIKVYDILGREVMTLVHGEQQKAGRYEVVFDASQLASGIYMYAIKASSFKEVKKMILLK